MTESRVAGRYAEALFQLAVERNAVEEVRRELGHLVELIEASPALEELLVRPDLEAEKKLTALRAALGEEAPEAMIALLETVLRHRRGDQLGGISAVYGALADEAAGLIRAEVTTVVPLTPEQRERLISVLSRMTGRRVELEERIDESILAGAQIKLGDRLIDGSAAGRIERMRAHLVRAQG